MIPERTEARSDLQNSPRGNIEVGIERKSNEARKSMRFLAYCYLIVFKCTVQFIPRLHDIGPSHALDMKPCLVGIFD